MAGFLVPGMVAPSWGADPNDPATTGAVAPQPAAPAAPPSPYGALTTALQQQYQQQQQFGQQIPGLVGAEIGALNQMMQMYGRPQSGPDPALLQLAAGFFAPTRTGSVGESIGTATNLYSGALSKQREQEFDRNAKLMQLKLTQAQLATKIPQMQMENSSSQITTLAKMAEIAKMEQDEKEKTRQRGAISDLLRDNSDLSDEQKAELRATPTDKIPETLARMRRDSQLTDKGIETFTSLGKDHQTATSLLNGFQDSFSGKGISVIGGVKGAIENTIGRTGKDSMFNKGSAEGEQRVAQAQWWMQYQDWKNKVRNELFGAALTPGEKAEFDKQEVSPSDGPDIVRKKLERQRAVVASAIARTRDSYIAQGKSRKAIDSALGFTPQRLSDISEPTGAPGASMPDPLGLRAR